MYIPKRFKHGELVDKETFSCFTAENNNNIYDLFEDLLLMSVDNLMDELENHYNKKLKIICNNWLWHKNPQASDYFQWRGLRNPRSKYYKAGSHHSYVPDVKKVSGIDFDVSGLKAEEVRKFIIERQDQPWAINIGGLEANVNWVHLDIRQRVNGRIVLFNP